MIEYNIEKEGVSISIATIANGNNSRLLSKR